MRKVSKTIKKINKRMYDEDIDSRFVLFKDYFNEESQLGEMFRDYMAEEVNNTDGGKVLPNFYDHYNTDVIINRFANRRFISLFPGFCTAVGILFTFIGLRDGLTGIQLGSIESTQSSIGTIVEGMSVAFNSSIYGISASLLINIADKISIGRLGGQISWTNKLLLEKGFTMPSVSYYESETLNLMKNQNENFKTFIEDISLKIAETISDELTPRFDHMNQLNERLVDSIQGTQVDGMDKIVNKFMDEVNSLMGDQFENMADTIEELMEWQKKSKETMDFMIEKMNDLGENQIEINKSSEDVLEKFNKSIDTIKDTVSVLEKSLIDVKEMNDMFNEQVEFYQEFMQSSVKQSDINRENIKNLNDITRQLEGAVNEYRSKLSELNSGLKDSSQMFGDSLSASLTRTFSLFDDHLSSITQKLASVVSDTQKNIQDIPDVLDEIKYNITRFNETIASISTENDEIAS